MQIKLFILIILAGLFFVNYAQTKVRFIMDSGEIETFKSKCPPSYVTCKSPQEGVGTACENKYASCRCPSTYVICKLPKTGGNAIGCDGKFLSSDCKCPSDYNTACVGKNNVIATGAISCDGKYKSADCKCPSNWKTFCDSPKQLEGASCILGSVTYRETCRCPSSYILCNNGGAEGASSCTESGFTKYTSCKAAECPAGTVNVNIYWGGKLKYIMDTSTGTQIVGTKKCKALPTCTSFGYITTTKCGSQKYLKCPFDNTKVYCPDMK